MNYRQEAISRMSRRKSTKVEWTLADRTIRFSSIPATAAKNWDGSTAGEGNNPEQKILEQMVWEQGKAPRYTNWW